MNFPPHEQANIYVMFSYGRENVEGSKWMKSESIEES